MSTTSRISRSGNGTTERTIVNSFKSLPTPPPQKADADPTPSTPVEVVVETVSVTQTIDPPAEPFLEPGHVRTDTQPFVDPIHGHTPIPQDARIYESSSSPLNAESIPVVSNPPQSPSVVSHSPSDTSASQSTSEPTPQTTEVTPNVVVRSPPSSPSSLWGHKLWFHPSGRFERWRIHASKDHEQDYNARAQCNIARTVCGGAHSWGS